MRFEFGEAHMGTQFRIVLYTADERFASTAARAAFDRIKQLDAMLSDYRGDSELIKLCARAGGAPESVSPELFFVLDQSQQLARRTDGAFDVTVGPVVRLWRQARRQRKLPDAQRLTEAQSVVGHQHVILDPERRTVQLRKPGMRLDLGGIAKGYAADEAIAALKRHGVRSALVAAGGDIVVSAAPPQQNGWVIGIAPLEGADQPAKEYLLLHDAAVSTSGDTEQFVEIDGKRYSHIIDPRTGMAIRHRSHVTVAAPRGIISDSLATAVSVLGPEKGLELIESLPDTAALFVQATASGTESLESSRFKSLPRRTSEPR